MRNTTSTEKEEGMKKKPDDKLTVFEGSGNVFADLEMSDPEKRLSDALERIAQERARDTRKPGREWVTEEPAEPKKLVWGETPWDDLSREELLREVQRLYAAVQAAHHLFQGLRDYYAPAEIAPILRLDPRGQTAAKCAYVVNRLESEWDAESLYHSFYRYANDLLFAGADLRIGYGWALCPACGVMVGRSLDGRESIGAVCRDVIQSDCKGILRALEWRDLEPTAWSEEAETENG